MDPNSQPPPPEEEEPSEALRELIYISRLLWEAQYRLGVVSEVFPKQSRILAEQLYTRFQATDSDGALKEWVPKPSSFTNILDTCWKLPGALNYCLIDTIDGLRDVQDPNARPFTPQSVSPDFSAWLERFRGRQAESWENMRRQGWLENDYEET